ncbi:hypothetical protein HS7_09590 [Sulfolobales archaeon HS-7]|nr:hypothetical protein HS7_09590 [Sulfolobales archaeon HS-7]
MIRKIVGTLVLVSIIMSIVVGSSAIGVVNNGEVLIGNQVTPYILRTNSIVGYLKFFYGNFSSDIDGNEVPGVSIQLNVVASNGYYFYWIQDVAVICNIGVNRYNITFLDNLWNLTSIGSQIGRVIGNGKICEYGDTRFYVYVYPHSVITKSPFVIFANATVANYNNQVKFLISFYFSNYTYSENVTYDKIIIPNQRNFSLVVGGSTPSGLFSDAEWVVGGMGDGAQATIYSWKAFAVSKYMFKGRYYTFPSAVTYSYDTAESVNPTQGIREYWNNTVGLVVEESGIDSQQFLWNINATLTFVNNSYIPKVQPIGAQWYVNVSGPDGISFYKTVSDPNYINMTGLPVGNYMIRIFLKIGNVIVYQKTFNSTYSTKFTTVNISSVTPFSVDNVTLRPGIYNLSIPGILIFPISYNTSNAEYLLTTLLVNGKPTHNFSILLNSTGRINVTAIYRAYYRLSFPFNLTYYVDGTKYYGRGGFYPSGSLVLVPSQNISDNLTLNAVQQTSFALRKPINYTHGIVKYYYVNFIFNYSIKVYINNKITSLHSGYYRNGTKISIMPQNITTNDELYEVIPQHFIITSPINITIQYNILYRFSLNFPYNISTIVNGKTYNSTSFWVPASVFIIPAQNISENGFRYVISEESILVAAPLTITPSYYVQYYINTPLPVKGFVNGKPANITSGYYNMSTIYIPSQLVYVNDSRFVIYSPTEVILTYPLNISIQYYRQFLVNVSYPIHGYVNGKEQLITTGYYNISSNITIPSLLAVNSSVRQIINTSQTFEVREPLLITIHPSYQYLVTIVYGNNVTKSWHTYGQHLILYRRGSILYDYYFEGTYNGNNITIIVTSPIFERLVPTINYELILTLSILMLFVLTITFISKWLKPH